jgi:hypothetical protein
VEPEALWYVPVGQLAQLVAPVAAPKVPAGQLVQLDKVVATPKVPIEQLKHTLAAFVEYMPTTQLAHADEADAPVEGENRPATQPLHRVEPVAD